MKRRQLLAGTGAVAATALSGCLDLGGGDGQAAANTESPSVERRDQRTIIVSNSGTAEGEPDLAILDLGIESTGESAGEVRNDLADRSEALRDALLEYGLDEDDVTTNRFRIHERIDRRAMEEDGVRPDSREAAEEYVYYQGTHSFSVEVDDIDAAGEVVDVAVDAGADEVGRVTFTLSDERRAELREEALTTAIADARSEAETIAAEIDASVVEATVVDASDGRVSPVHRDVAFDAAAATETAGGGGASTGFETGDVTVTADVRIKYRME